MASNSFRLDQALLIGRAATTAGQSSILAILEYLVNTFKLESAGLKLFSWRSLRFCPLQFPADTDAPPPRLSKQERLPLKAGSHAGVGQTLFFPVGTPGLRQGYLWLRGVTGPIPRALNQQLVDLAEYLEDRFHLQQMRPLENTLWLTALRHSLRQSRDLDQLVHYLLKILLRSRGVLGLSMRLLHGGTVLSGSFSCFVPGFRRRGVDFLKLEEEQASRLLNNGGRRFFHPESAEVPMLILSLQRREQLVGTLALYGGQWTDLPEKGCWASEQTLLTEVAEEVACAVERHTTFERYALLSGESERKLKETTALLHIAQALHSTLQINELPHVILSAAVMEGGGGFARALLFLANERSRLLRGMLGVTRESAGLVFPSRDGRPRWENPLLSDSILEAQHRSAASLLAKTYSLNMDGEHPLARAARLGRVVLVNDPAGISPAWPVPFACVPLSNQHGTYGVLLLDNHEKGTSLDPEALRFLELFAKQAGSALDKVMLLSRLKAAHRDLLETQERLLQGERLAALGEMSASLAHELRNPLVAIGGYAQRLVRRITGDSDAHAAAEIIARETRCLEEMLKQILDFSKKQFLCLDECWVEEEIDQALELVDDLLGQNAIKLVREKNPKLPVIVADRQKLRQVLVNLFTNACHAMSHGGTLWISTRTTNLRGETAVEIRVEDTGGGISSEVLRNIFNPFFSTKEQGTGLGLSISHRIVEHHRGLIEVYNTERGARFSLQLPMTQNALGRD